MRTFRQTVQPLRRLAIVSLALGLGARPLSAQSRQEIGTISGGNPVLLETKTVSRAAGIITAAVRVKFLKPTKVPAGFWYSSRTIVMLDCKKQLVAVKENWYYADEAGVKIGNHKVVGIPGYATPLPGSMPKVALDHLCRTR